MIFRFACSQSSSASLFAETGGASNLCGSSGGGSSTGGASSHGGGAGSASVSGETSAGGSGTVSFGVIGSSAAIAGAAEAPAEPPKGAVRFSQDIPVLGDYDVCVVGAGPGGVGAAVAAARAGKRTILVEHYGYPGGVGTNCNTRLSTSLTPAVSNFSRI